MGVAHVAKVRRKTTVLKTVETIKLTNLNFGKTRNKKMQGPR
jgi:hypothetical protein